MMGLYLFEIRARDGLFAAQAGEPDVIRFQRAQKRIDFSQFAALCWIFPIQDAEFGFLFENGFLGEYIYKIQVPLFGEVISEFVSLAEVVPSFQKEDGDLRKPFSQKSKDDDVFRLKAAGEASALARLRFENCVDDLVGVTRFQLFPFGEYGHVLSSLRLENAFDFFESFAERAWLYLDR
jgi:hypothetical protein